MSEEHGTVDEDTLRRAAVMWAFVVKDQAERLHETVGEFNLAVHAQLQSGEDQVPWSETWRAGADMYFFLSAAAQLRKCISVLGDDDMPELPEDRMVLLLRNFTEHWEDPTGWSAVELKGTIPDAEPGRLAFTKHDVWIEGVSMRGIVEWAMNIDSILRASL